MLTQAELGLAEADERIAEADRNIQRIASLLPDLAVDGDVSLEVQRRLELMTRALLHLRAQRRAIIESLDGDEPLPRIVRRPH
jgi:hypothetical protein